ncbi:translation initiation factor IF-2 [Streptomyces sp. NTH33]|nr:translation initiation factor IF-2 [Streptomyces sp. NTH33]
MAGGRGSGGGTSFESMSHEQMLAWLDRANAGEVQAAADRLTTAAEEIRKIAEELKVRPQWVAWKGEGAEAFRTWANDLANSALRLGDFSEGAAKWLGQASNAIATAQASIPRDTKGAQANLAAAVAARNDPDAAAIRTKSESELAALEADREKVRLEAAAQMRKLGQSYKLSTAQMDDLERPKFPPPPDAIKPPEPHRSSEDLDRPGDVIPRGAGGGGITPVPAAGIAGNARTAPHSPAAPGIDPSQPPSGSLPNDVRPPAVEPVTHVGIDSVSAPPGVHQPGTGPTGGPPATARPDTGTLPPMSGPVPPIPRGSARMPSASGGPEKSVGGGRLPTQPGQRPNGPTSAGGVTGGGPASGRNLPGPAGTVGRAVSSQGPAAGRGGPSGSGIVGGRPGAPAAIGRSAGRVPGTPLAGPLGTGSGSVSRLPNIGATAQPVTRTAGPTAGRAASTPRDGIVGGTPQQVGRSPMRPGAQLPSAPTRGGISGGVPSEAGSRGAVRGAPSESTSRARQRNKKRRTDRRSEPPSGD